MKKAFGKKPRNVVVIHRTTWASGRMFLASIFGFAARKGGWNTRLLQPPESPFAEIIRTIREEKPDGIIATDVGSPEIQSALAASKIPLVYTGPHTGVFAKRKTNAIFMQPDTSDTGRSAAAYLRQLGKFRSYGYVPDPNPAAFWSTERQRGFCDFLAEQGIVAHVFQSTHPSGSMHDRKNLESWIDSLPKPAAIMAAWDYRATQVTDACRVIRARIPTDVSLISVDDDELLCESSSPTITSIRTPLSEMGTRAAVELNRMMLYPRSCGATSVTSTSKTIVERESTRSFTSSAKLVNQAMSYIEKNATSGIRVPDVVAHLGVSRRLADLRFRENGLESIHKVIINRRLRIAAQLLKETSITPSRIATRAGFSDEARFNYAFNAIYKTSPSQWRKDHT